MIMHHKLNRYVLAVPLLIGATNLAFGATEYYSGQEVVAKEVLVKFKTSAAVANIQSVKAQEDVDVDEHVGSIGVRKLRSRTLDVSTLIRHLKGRADVEYVEPNIIVHTTAIPNDPSFGLTWGLRNTGQTVNGVVGIAGADIKAETAWNISVGSRANVVGVVDTGIDYNHPDLAANVWSAPSSFTVTIGGVTITCAAGTHGFNAINNTCNPMDDNASNYHGTHVSGTIGAVGNNGAGVAGVNQVASIMGLKFLNSTGSGTYQAAINAIEFAVQAKAKFGTAANVRVLNNSWGCQGTGCFSQALLDELNKANNSDMLFVAAAGNANSNNDTVPFYPANFSAPNVISVAATNNKDARAGFSDYGATTVHLGAPGDFIYSTKLGSAYQYLSGTSMAGGVNSFV